MARIRTIKPEFWTSEQVMECSPNARLLFIGMWNFADDEGRLSSSGRRLKAQIFPSDDFTSENVRGMIGELSSNGLILLYTIEDQEIIQVTGWHHQKIDRPQKSKFPPPQPEMPSGIRRVLDEHSPLEGKGKGREKEDSSVALQPYDHAALQKKFDGLESECRLAAGLENDPSPGLIVIGPIHDLLAAGWSLEAHVLPALRGAAAAGKRGKTWKFYVPIITDGRETPAKASPPPPPAETFLEKTHRIWRQQLTGWKQYGKWSDQWGAHPDSPSCAIPRAFVDAWLAEHPESHAA